MQEYILKICLSEAYSLQVMCECVRYDTGWSALCYLRVLDQWLYTYCVFLITPKLYNSHSTVKCGTFNVLTEAEQ